MQIDCTVEVDLCRDHHITGFPSLRVFRKGHDEVMNHGLREHESYKGTLLVEPCSNCGAEWESTVALVQLCYAHIMLHMQGFACSTHTLICFSARAEHAADTTTYCAVSIASCILHLCKGKPLTQACMWLHLCAHSSSACACMCAILQWHVTCCCWRQVTALRRRYCRLSRRLCPLLAGRTTMSGTCTHHALDGQTHS